MGTEASHGQEFKLVQKDYCRFPFNLITYALISYTFKNERYSLRPSNEGKSDGRSWIAFTTSVLLFFLNGEGA